MHLFELNTFPMQDLSMNLKCIIFLHKLTIRKLLSCLCDSLFNLIILSPAAACFGTKNKNYLWKTAQRSPAYYSEYNIAQKDVFTDIDGSDLRFKRLSSQPRVTKKALNTVICFYYQFLLRQNM